MAALATTARALLFTDPSVLGITKTGDVDDIAALLLLAQAYGAGLTVVICDDADGLRYQNFMNKYGYDIVAAYGCTIIQESALGGGIAPNTTVFVHAPTTADTATWLNRQNPNINKIFAQGEAPGRANFKNAPAMWTLLNSADIIKRTTFYSSNDTKFVINSQTVNFDPPLHPKAELAHSDFYGFKRFSAFGLPVENTQLIDMLYSDTGGPAETLGGPGTIGNGIKSKLPTINKLRQRQQGQQMPGKDSNDLKRQLGVLEEALTRTYTGENPTTLSNLRDTLWLLDQYCDYKTYLTREGKLPNMSHFQSIPPCREPCDPDVKLLFEPDESTPLFDGASAAFGLGLVAVPGPGDTSHIAPLRKVIQACLQSYSDKLKGFPEDQLWKPTPPIWPNPWMLLSATFPPTQPGDWGVDPYPKRPASGGRKTRRRRRKRRKTRRKGQAPTTP